LKNALGEQGVVIAAQKCAPIDQLAALLTQKHQVLTSTAWPELRSLPVKI